jgi:hypothetical protein
MFLSTQLMSSPSGPLMNQIQFSENSQPTERFTSQFTSTKQFSDTDVFLIDSLRTFLITFRIAMSVQFYYVNLVYLLSFFFQS